MKRKVVTCDVCGKDITDDASRFRFREYGKVSSFFDVYKYKEKLDMCDECYEKLCQFVREAKRK